MRMLRAFVLSLALVWAAGAVSPARGEESADPGQRATAAAEAFPEPAREHGFEFACYVLERGAPYGRATLSARPERREGETVWRVRDAIEPLRGDRDRVVVEAVLDRTLGCLEGSYHRRNAGGFLSATWRRTGSGAYAFDYETQDYVNELEVGSPRPALCTTAGLLLFLRLAPRAPGAFEVPEVDPNPAGGDPLVMPARIEVHGVADWRVRGGTRRARISSFTRGKQSVRVAFDEEKGEFLGVDMLGTPFQFVPAGSGTVGLADPEQPGLATPIERAMRRTRAMTAARPVPCRPLDYEGQVRFGDVIVGTVRIRATPASYQGRPAWQTLHARTRKAGEGAVGAETSAVIGRDLATLRGERVLDQPTGRRTSTWIRKEGGIETRHAAGEDGGAPFLSPAPSDAVTGLVPVLLFLRDAPAQPALYVLPGWDPRWARAPKAGSGSLASNLSDVHVDVRGSGHFDVAGASRPSWWARCSLRTGEIYDVHFDPQSRALLGIVGILPRLTVAPKGLPGEAVTWFDAIDTPPKTWRQAFVKFGRGYHLPRRDLLAAAFHWPSMHADALAKGSYPAGTGEAVVREQWIQVFESMSKHRTEADCDDLLFQIFMTSRETVHADGSVSLATLPAYGGHTYRLREVEGRWIIVKID